MNLVGKIITMLILLLSVCFMMIGIMVNASHQNWRQLAMENKTLVEQLTANRSAILSQATNKELVIEKEKVARMLRIQQLESQLRVARDDYGQAIEQLAAQRVKAEESFNIVKEAENRIAEQDKSIDNLQGQLRLLTEDVSAQRSKVVAMTGQIFELKSIEENLETSLMNLTSVHTAQTKVMSRHGLTQFSNTDHIPRELDGRVTAINRNTIAVNLGLDDGLRDGHTVDIVRDGRFVGTATIFDAQSNRAAARIDTALTKVPVQKGDEVTTKWVVQDIRGR